MHLRWLKPLVKHDKWPDRFGPKPCAVRTGVLVETAYRTDLGIQVRVVVVRLAYSSTVMYPLDRSRPPVCVV